MIRMTKEREEMIRTICSGTLLSWPGDIMRELLVELDATREALKAKNETQVTGYCIRCEAIQPKYEALEKERDEWKEEYQNVSKFATDYEQQRDLLKQENSILRREIEILRQNGPFWPCPKSGSP